VTDVYLEVGATKVFACAVDWPGWCRAARTEDAALEALLSYADRYRAAVPWFAPGALHVVGRLQGNATTDFGAPDVRGPWDDVPLAEGEPDRLADVLAATWAAFDAAVATAPAELCKGPRGGGRDRDAVADHVRDAERSCGRKYGVRVPPRTPWDEQRATLLEAVHRGAPDGRWPLLYAVRRSAWHVLDHAWEVEDRSS